MHECGEIKVVHKLRICTDTKYCILIYLINLFNIQVIYVYDSIQKSDECYVLTGHASVSELIIIAQVDFVSLNSLCLITLGYSRSNMSILSDWMNGNRTLLSLIYFIGKQFIRFCAWFAVSLSGDANIHNDIPLSDRN